MDQTFSVEANVFHSELTHSHFVALKTKDAIVDQFRQNIGKRPWVDTENPHIFIDVHISHNLCTISLDSSGHSLHKRGYRVAADKAPINEVLAAGMIHLTGWKGDSDFYDPMCGSGTIAIEAALFAMHIPSGYYRKQFAFMNWEGYDEAIWKQVKEEADSHMGELEHQIFASDRSDKAVGFARANLKSAGLHKDVELHCHFFDAIRPEAKNGLIIMNPPYGMRLEERGELKDLYRGIGDALKRSFTGFDAWIITPSLDTFKFIGLRPARRVPLYNGPIETRFLKFEVYQGSKRYGEENRETSGPSYSRRREDDSPRGDREDSYRKGDFKERQSGRFNSEKRDGKPSYDNKRKPFSDDRPQTRSNDSWKKEERPGGDSERRREWEQSDYVGRRRIRSFINHKSEEGEAKPVKRKPRRPRTDEL